MISNKISLANGQNAENWLFYDYAYSGYSSGYDDGFRIDISTNCGNTWDSIYGAFGPNLQTVPYFGNAWSPTCGSWIRDSIDLTSFGLNGDTIMVRFAAVNDYGNNFYLDNININGGNILSNIIQDGFNADIYPNPNKGIFNIKTSAKKLLVEIYSTIGALVAREIINDGNKQIDLSHQPKGIYFIKMINNRNIELKKLIIH